MSLRGYICSGVLLSFIGVAGLGAYARIWESRQPEREIKNVIVENITPYEHANDIHWDSKGFLVFIKGEKMPIDVPSKNIHCLKEDYPIKEKDMVNLIVRRSFPLFGDELDGLYLENVTSGINLSYDRDTF